MEAGRNGIQNEGNAELVEMRGESKLITGTNPIISAHDSWQKIDMVQINILYHGLLWKNTGAKKDHGGGNDIVEKAWLPTQFESNLLIRFFHLTILNYWGGIIRFQNCRMWLLLFFACNCRNWRPRIWKNTLGKWIHLELRSSLLSYDLIEGKQPRSKCASSSPFPMMVGSDEEVE